MSKAIGAKKMVLLIPLTLTLSHQGEGIFGGTIIRGNPVMCGQAGIQKG